MKSPASFTPEEFPKYESMDSEEESSLWECVHELPHIGRTWARPGHCLALERRRRQLSGVLPFSYESQRAAVISNGHLETRLRRRKTNQQSSQRAPVAGGTDSRAPPAHGTRAKKAGFTALLSD
jgi:hypothetical protein